MLNLTPEQVRRLAQRLAGEYAFQPSEIDRMTLEDMVWWLDGDGKGERRDGG